MRDDSKATDGQDLRERSTVSLLQRWHRGEQAALHELLERDLPWIRAHVKRRVGQKLARFGDTEDFVQDAMVQVLRYGPRFVLSDRDAFRGLMVRLVENSLRDKLDYHQAAKRDAGRERPMPRDSVLDLDPPRRDVTHPSVSAMRGEEVAWIRLAIELLPPEDREVVLLRHWEELGYGEIAERLGVSESGARMRCNRAMPKLLARMKQIRSGRLQEALESD